MINVKHYCPDWDFLMIYPGSPEMDACTCKLSWDDFQHQMYIGKEERKHAQKVDVINATFE